MADVTDSSFTPLCKPYDHTKKKAPQTDTHTHKVRADSHHRQSSKINVPRDVRRLSLYLRFSASSGGTGLSLNLRWSLDRLAAPERRATGVLTHRLSDQLGEQIILHKLPACSLSDWFSPCCQYLELIIGCLFEDPHNPLFQKKKKKKTQEKRLNASSWFKITYTVYSNIGYRSLQSDTVIKLESAADDWRIVLQPFSLNCPPCVSQSKHSANFCSLSLFFCVMFRSVYSHFFFQLAYTTYIELEIVGGKKL